MRKELRQTRYSQNLRVWRKGQNCYPKVVDGGKKLIDMVGGGENALKMLGVVIGAIMAYKSREKNTICS